MIDARSRGEKVYFDERRVRDIEEFAPDIEFSPDDIPKLFFESNDKQHGMGYEPLKNSNVLDESFALKVDSLKTKANSKGIKGQAFGELFSSKYCSTFIIYFKHFILQCRIFSKNLH